MISKPKYKIGRRLGAGVFEKCQTPKFALSEARKAKGKGKGRPKALSEFGTQLLEKQKIRYTYGLSAKQLSRYVNESMEKKGSNTRELLFQRLESRLDNVVYRLGIANTRAFARQLVSHGHITVNGTRTTIPSYAVRPGDTISVREGSKGSPVFQNLETKLKDYTAPKWLSFNIPGLSAKILAKPELTETHFNIDTVLEFYSR